ncbi:hypothetical protein FQN55_001781 [Onygenales sp. PD_40]|nr:hypothetical protein FQN55_001781 [Onygenales sp. PD_40]KAK2759722.1 hypothetical protein FQN53_008015 [Emmonsiellopsis sp. PD_33]
MSSPQSPAGNYWGCLIRADKSATPLLEQLCLGIAKLIADLEQSGTEDLTPENLARFYRAVGGNYDGVFLHTPRSSLSFIYQSLGCFHTLQPTSDPFRPPSIPALRPHGFVRWQTIQLLLCPSEHVSFLQNAVKKFDIVNPSGGGVFPKVIPRDAFPTDPDPEMVKWHETVSQKLEKDARKHNNSSHSAGPSDRFTANSKAGFHSLDGSTDESLDYFARRGSTTSQRPDASRTCSHDAPSPFTRPHRRVVPEFTSPLATNPELRQEDVAEEPIPVEKPKKARSRPASPHRRRSRRGRSSTPSRRSRNVSPSSSSDESDGPTHQPMPQRRRDEDVNHDKLFPSHSQHARRHSHDAAYSRKQRWNQSPPRRHRLPEDHYPPETTQTRDFYSSYHVPPYHISKAPELRPSYSSETTRRRMSQSPHRPKIPGAKFHRNIFEDEDYSNSAPPSPISPRRSQRPTMTTMGSSSHTRPWVPKLDHETAPTYSSRRKGSASGGSRSSSSTERARAMSIGGKPIPYFRIDQTSRRYVTPPPSINGGGVSLDFDPSGEVRLRHGRRAY